MLCQSNSRPATSPWSMAITVALIVYWFTLLLGTHLPAEQLPVKLNTVDKLVHCAAYAGLALLFLVESRFRWQRSNAAKAGTSIPSRRVVGVLAILLVHAAIDESTQTLIPGRVPSFLDWAADCIGAIGGIGIYLAASRLWVPMAQPSNR